MCISVIECFHQVTGLWPKKVGLDYFAQKVCQFAKCPDYVIFEGSTCMGITHRLVENDVNHSQDQILVLTVFFGPNFVSLKTGFVQSIYYRVSTHRER